MLYIKSSMLDNIGRFRYDETIESADLGVGAARVNIQPVKDMSV